MEQMDSVGLCAMEQLDLTAGHLGCLGLCAMEQIDSGALCSGAAGGVSIRSMSTY